jgi:5,10-methylene-tetrahydrofolate dehydrogenase/methenyl tetrahydrofolate cyclohydrolase
MWSRSRERTDVVDHVRLVVIAALDGGSRPTLTATGRRARGARAVVLGRSILVGKPLAQLLLAASATVTS